MLGPSVVLEEVGKQGSVVEAPCSVGWSVSGTAVGGDAFDWAKELVALLVVVEAVWFSLIEAVAAERLGFLQGRGRERTGGGSCRDKSRAERNSGSKCRECFRLLLLMFAEEGNWLVSRRRGCWCPSSCWEERWWRLFC